MRKKTNVWIYAAVKVVAVSLIGLALLMKHQNIPGHELVIIAALIAYIIVSIKYYKAYKEMRKNRQNEN